MKERAFHIRYLGFESAASGRRLEYAITAPGSPARRAAVEIPAEAFIGPLRVSFQDSATIGYEKLRVELETETEQRLSLHLVLTPDDIERFRPRRRAASKRL